MTGEDLPPLAPDVADLLAVTATREAMPADVRDRLRSRFGLPAVAVPPAAPSNPSHAASAAARTGALSRPLLRAATLAFAVGGAAGAGLHAGLARPPAPRTVVVVRTVEVPARAVAPPDSPTLPAVVPAAIAPPAQSPTAALPPRATPPRAADSPAGDDAALRAEQRVLDMARTALTRAQYASALDALESHARRFAHGQLAEERDSMTVQALIGAGRYDDARARAARFSREHPRSLLRPAVESAVRTIP